MIDRLKILFTFLVLFIISCNKKKNNHVQLPEGIWIEKAFYESFEKTKSAVKSKKAFNSVYPVGLRINYQEYNGSKLNIGYSRLHDHIFRPEVSISTINTVGDTIYEQGHFTIDINQIDEKGYYKSSPLMCFDGIAELKYDREGKTIELLNSTNSVDKAIRIEYIRIDSTFSNLYKFPNPLYYYTRKKILFGTYTIEDSLGNVLSDNLEFQLNGSIKGMDKFNNMKLYYSTDIYCGPPMTDDRIVIIDDILEDSNKSFAYNIKINENGSILLSGYNRKKKVWERLTYKLNPFTE